MAQRFALFLPVLVVLLTLLAVTLVVIGAGLAWGAPGALVAAGLGLLYIAFQLDSA